MKHKKRLRDHERVQLFYHCGCGPTPVITPLRLDAGGDFIDDVPHGFFPYRLGYLR